MRNILNIKALSIAVAALIAVGCIEDKGNYDYDTTYDYAVEVGVESPVMGFQYIVGMEIVITPSVVINDPSINEDRLAYTWHLEGEVVSTERVLRLNDIPIGSYIGGVTVTDTRYGTVYYTNKSSTGIGGDYFLLRVTSEYTHGFAVLSNDDGASKLGYIRYANNEWEDFMPNIYPGSNGNEDLGGEPVSLMHHSYNSNGVFFALHVTQNGGIGPVDMATATMERIGLINREFIGSYPTGMKVKDVLYKGGNVFLLADNGKVYVRPEETNGFDVLPHGGRFPNIPMYIDKDMRVNKWINVKCLQAPMSSSLVVIAFDDLNKRMLMINSETSRISVMNRFAEGDSEIIKPGDPGTDGITTNSLTFPSPEDLSGYDLALLGAFNTDLVDYPDNNSIVSVLKGADNKYYCFIFDWFCIPYSGYTDIDLKKFFEFPVQNIDADMKYAVYIAGKPYMFFTANGNKDLYFMNLETNATKLFYSHTSPITTIQAGETTNGIAALYESFGMGEYATYSEYVGKLAIGTADGKVIILDATPSEVEGAGTANVLRSYNTSNGPIVDIEYLSLDWSQATSVK